MGQSIKKLEEIKTTAENNVAFEAELAKLESFAELVDNELNTKGKYILGGDFGVLDIQVGVLIHTLHLLDYDILKGIFFKQLFYLNMYISAY